HMKRLYIRPGITGLWQVSGRNRLSFDQMVQLDIAYIEQWSLWQDIKIIIKTIPVFLHLDQAY
ncbi:MAG: undecaprenyl-phosphate glucose phosphotransferase, partial [Clostridia bacterium]|nr:undecaprenyl-phosphate glucose phosphotransferase [Clostridia bacterium]